MAELFEMTRLLRRLVWFSLAASLLIAGTMGTFYILERDARQALLATREVARLARTAYSLATDRETGIRGYQLTHDQKSLVPEIVGRAQLPHKLDSLTALTASDSDQSNGVRAIAVSLKRWENQFADPALRGIPSGESVLAGKPLFDPVRAGFAAFLSGTDQRFRREEARLRRLQLINFAVVLSELLALVGVLLFVIRGRLTKQARELGEQQELLEQQAGELELQMTEVQATKEALAEREESLSKSEERYRYAALVSNDAIYDWDVAPNHFEWNEGMKGLFGYPEEEVGNTLEWIVGRLHPEDTERVMGSFNAVFGPGGGDKWRGEYRLKRKDGRYANAEGRA